MQGLVPPYRHEMKKTHLPGNIPFSILCFATEVEDNDNELLPRYLKVVADDPVA